MGETQYTRREFIDKFGNQQPIKLDSACAILPRLHPRQPEPLSDVASNILLSSPQYLAESATSRVAIVGAGSTCRDVGMLLAELHRDGGRDITLMVEGKPVDFNATLAELDAAALLGKVDLPRCDLKDLRGTQGCNITLSPDELAIEATLRQLKPAKLDLSTFGKLK